MQKRLSVLVVTHDSAPHVSETLEAAAAQLGPDDELIVIDNGSGDETPEAVRRAAPGARLELAGANLGFADGANRAAALAQGDVLLFLNPDAVPAPGAFEALIAGAERWDVWQGLVTYPGGDVVNSAGGELHPLGFGWAGGCEQPVSSVATGPRPVGFASGACLAVKRVAWEELGGFPGSFFMYCEDVDLSLRARLAGFDVGIEPAAVFHHGYEFERGARKWWLLERNRWFVVLRTFPSRLLYPLLPVLLLIEPALLVRAARQGWAGAKLRAEADVMRALPRLLRERLQIKTQARIGARAFLAAMTPQLESPYFGRLASTVAVRFALGALWRLLRIAAGRA